MTDVKDPLDDILADLEDDDDKKTDLMSPEDVKALKAQLEERDKKIAGLLKETQQQRKKRQDTETRLDELTRTVSGILTTRQTVPVVSPVQKIDAVIKGDYDDDGNPIVKADQLKAIHADEINALNHKVASLEALLQASVQSQSAEVDGQKTINAIVGSDERFGPAYNKYQAARKWVEDKVLDYQKENNLGGIMTSGQALDEVFDDSVEAEFAARFPNINLERVVTAEDSKRHFRNTLSSIAETMTPDTGSEDRKKGSLNKLLRKPSALGKSPNAKGSEATLLERLKSFSTEDLLKMSDEQAAAIERALSKEEE